MKTYDHFMKKYGKHYFMLLPFFSLFLVFFLMPMMYGIGISFMKWNGIKAPVFVGLENYRRIFTHPNTWIMYKNLILFAVSTLILGISLSLFVSLITQKLGKIAGFIVAVLYVLPVLMPPYLSTAIFRWMFTPDYGIVNIFLKALGFQSISWITEPGYAIAAVVAVDMWKATGTNTLFFMTGIKEIPRELYEAADMDGAGFWKKSWYITLPGLEPIIFLAFTNGIIWALQVFDIPWLMSISLYTNYGGRGNVMLYPIMEIVGLTFGRQKLGEASAQAVLLLFISLTITSLRFFLRNRRKA